MPPSEFQRIFPESDIENDHFGYYDGEGMELNVYLKNGVIERIRATTR
jgi:hypothetical protein